jgi:outer membrane protein OmpA-like peptidoglycan-associated protein
LTYRGIPPNITGPSALAGLAARLRERAVPRRTIITRSPTAGKAPRGVPRGRIAAAIAVAVAAVIAGAIVLWGDQRSDGREVNVGTSRSAATTTPVVATTPVPATPSPTHGQTTVTTASTPTRTTLRRAVVVRAAPTTAPPVRPLGPPPPRLPDGTPVPVVVEYDGPHLRLSGLVRSPAAHGRALALAKLNSQVPLTVIEDRLRVDARQSANVGVRVMEKNSARFPAGSTVIGPAQAAELDRVVRVMSAMGHLTVLVIGHSDARGSAQANLELSSRRAVTVVDYLVGHGISAERLSARGIGARDPLAQETSDQALALNRRSEFVFYGFLAGL